VDSRILWSFLGAGLASACVTPLARRVARATGYLDHPSVRKAHRAPTPLLGGAAVVAGFLVGLALRGAPVFSDPTSSALLPACAIGLVVVFLVGLVDDRRGMDPLLKLGLQCAASIPVIASGASLHVAHAPLLGPIVSFFWMATVMNAANFLDNMDGILAGVSAIVALGLAFLSASGAPTLAHVVAIALAGAAVGFLFFNFAPASIFLGDAGSLAFGYLIGVVSLLRLREAGPLSAASLPAAMVVGFLLFDITLVTVVRVREKRKVYLGGQDHSTHRLRQILGSPRRAAIAAYSLAAIPATIGVLSARLDARLVVTVALVLIVAFGILGSVLVKRTSAPRGA